MIFDKYIRNHETLLLISTSTYIIGDVDPFFWQSTDCCSRFVVNIKFYITVSNQLTSESIQLSNLSIKFFGGNF